MIKLSVQVSTRIQQFAKNNNLSPDQVWLLIERDYLIPILNEGLLSMPEKDRSSFLQNMISKVRKKNAV